MLVSDGSEEIETVTIVDVLRRAGAVVELAKVEPTKDAFKHKNKLLCQMSRGINIEADSHFTQGHLQVDYKAVVLPGGLHGAKIFE